MVVNEKQLRATIAHFCDKEDERVPGYRRVLATTIALILHHERQNAIKATDIKSAVRKQCQELANYIVKDSADGVGE